MAHSSLRVKILRDHLGWYVTFLTGDAARRASMVLSNSKQLAHQSVSVTIHPVPAPLLAASKKKAWKEEEIVEEAQRMIVRELRTMLEKDIKRIAAVEMMTLIAKEKESMMGVRSGAATAGEKRGIKGLSFKKQNKKIVVEEVRVEEEEQEREGEPEKELEKVDEDEKEVIQRPKKKRKKEVKKVQRVVQEVESEDEDMMDPVRSVEVLHKRGASEEQADEENAPLRKKQKVEAEFEIATKGKKMKKAGRNIVERVEDVYPDEMDYDVPSLAHVRLTPASDLTPSPSPAPEVKRRPPRVVTPPPTPPPDPLSQGLCEDDEDIYYLKLALEGFEPPDSDGPVPPAQPIDSQSPSFRKHFTGSARTEGYYKITHAEKAAYVAQYQARAAAAVETIVPVEEPQQTKPITSSRSNRANARRRAQGLEEINQVQRAVALSKGETAASELTFKFNQLQTRKKHLRFARSPIHDWGLYAMEKISRGEMVIEYVGEVIRAQVADKREKAYERQGIGSSYLFRIDEDLVVDATKKGNLGYVLLSCAHATYVLIPLSAALSIILVTPIVPPKSSPSTRRRRSSSTRNKILNWAMRLLMVRPLFFFFFLDVLFVSDVKL